MYRDAARAKARRIAVLCGALGVIAVIVWIDIATGLWQELVILSGLAAGLVTFLLTALVLGRLMEKSTSRRWAPVNRLALSEFLHALADEEHSELSRGHVIPRSLSAPRASADSADQLAQLHALRGLVVKERKRLSDALSRWAHFLASSGDNELIMRHVADIALQLDRVRDSALEVEMSPQTQKFTVLIGEIDRCNALFIALVAELELRLRVQERLTDV
ncbi:hypothetical protein [Microbacterium sp. A84]|uniref:hypothetical protein n=1 Tax=Microbacterium sp. A84 TaxID=3450715 RepID=UPI003F4363B5